MPHTAIHHARLLRPLPRWQMDWHEHTHTELELVLTGSMRTRFADGHVEVSTPGRFKWHPPGMAHAEQVVPGPPLTFLFVAATLPAEIETKAWSRGGADAQGRIGATLNWIIDECAEGITAANTALADHLLRALARELDRLARPESALVTQVRRYLAGRLDQPISLADLAGHVRLSRHYFCRAFARASGMTPMSFVRAQRLAMARALRGATHMPLRAIAPLVGFSDGHQLSRALGRQRGD